MKSVAKVLTVRKYTAEKAADEELQKELAAQAQDNPEPVAEVVVEEAIPEEAVQQKPQMYRRWMKKLYWQDMKSGHPS